MVWATGLDPYDAKKMDNLGFGKHKNIITNMMMERLAAPNGPTGGKIMRPSDGKAPASVAFVQCAGSRDENYLPYCSYICCMASLKQVTYLRAQYPDAKIYIFYIDLRAPGYRYERFYETIKKDPNVVFIKGKVAAVERGPDHGQHHRDGRERGDGGEDPAGGRDGGARHRHAAHGGRPEAAGRGQDHAGRVHPERLRRRRDVRGRLRQQAGGCRLVQPERHRHGPQSDSNPGETVGGRP
ncbi:MAG: hypothetical protein MZV70_06895 [Desulfobacterales bacterium]|nr:hypothetical protein [Desulfobacterales bacterium]